MNINGISTYSINPYSDVQNNNTQVKDVTNNTKIDEVSKKNHHHHRHGSDNFNKVQSNGTDSVQLSSQAVDAISSATKSISYGQPYCRNAVSSSSQSSNITSMLQSTIDTEE